MKWHYSTQYKMPSQEVLRHFTDRDFQKRKLDEIGGGDITEFEFDGRRYRMRSRRRVSLEAPAPGFIAKALGSGGMMVVYEDRWDVETATGSVGFEFAGVPVQVTCTTALIDNAGGCEMRFDWDIKAKVPVVGGQVEKLLVADLEIKLPAEVNAIRRLLGEQS
jgi:hypothetical protein